MARTAGSALSWGVLAALGLAVAADPVACTIAPAGEKADPFEDSEVAPTALEQVGPGVVIPALQRFDAALAALELAAADWGASGAGADRDAAQVAWWAAMEAWQELEPMQLGPQASSLTAVGGQDLRDEIYSWPTVNPCRIDQVVGNGEWLEDGFFELNLVNAYGLDGMEQALYGADENVCPSQIDINADGTWDALGPEGIAAQRAAYTGAMAAHARGLTAQLIDAWRPEGGDWSGALAAGAAGPYGGDAAALNAVFDALFYLETRTKDRKLAQPLGLRDCVEAACPESVEALPSGASRAAIAANLRGFRRLFTGEEGAGIDDLLVERGEDALVTDLLAAVDAAIAVAEADDTPIDEALSADRASVEALHDAVKAVTDLLKGDVATVLTLTIPAEAAGDND